MGTPHYAREILKALLDDKDIVVPLVITQPDRPVGRKRLLKMSEVKVLAEDRGLEIAQPESLKEDWIYRRVVRGEARLHNSGCIWTASPKKDIGYCSIYKSTRLTSTKYRGAIRSGGNINGR